MSLFAFDMRICLKGDPAEGRVAGSQVTSGRLVVTLTVVVGVLILERSVVLGLWVNTLELSISSFSVSGIYGKPRGCLFVLGLGDIRKTTRLPLRSRSRGYTENHEAASSFSVSGIYGKPRGCLFVLGLGDIRKTTSLPLRSRSRRYTENHEAASSFSVSGIYGKPRGCLETTYVLIGVIEPVLRPSIAALPQIDASVT
ncbi:hypothetical protein DPMN_007395 [Dreissena polymorpha]|uniref:Uncharacterized protein n=1 Tax=Dreissena polymorpha TaxID=45954 RepID=A0A9D4RY87_DREPO|nr:hypothetical protein DPMN_007395 [Dreissena polymorpha]